MKIINEIPKAGMQEALFVIFSVKLIYWNL